MGLNSDCSTKDLQKVSMSLENCGGKAPLLKFKHEYPILFEYLHAVFGLMMSYSCLCEKIHGMTRASLRSGTDMNEADARRSFASGLGYHLKQERRDLASESAGSLKKKSRPVKDNRSKAQQGMVSKQLLREADRLVSEATYLLLQDNNGMPSLTAIFHVGRRSQDKKRLKDQATHRKGKGGWLKARGVLGGLTCPINI